DSISDGDRVTTGREDCITPVAEQRERALARREMIIHEGWRKGVEPVSFNAGKAIVAAAVRDRACRPRSTHVHGYAAQWNALGSCNLTADSCRRAGGY